VQKLLDATSRQMVDVGTADGHTPLHIAAVNGLREIAQILVETVRILYIVGIIHILVSCGYKPSFSLHDPLAAALLSPSFTRQQWSLLYCFQNAQGHCGACKKKWNQAATDLCSCGGKQTMSHIVDSCPLSKLNGGLSQLPLLTTMLFFWLISCGS